GGPRVGCRSRCDPLLAAAMRDRARDRVEHADDGEPLRAARDRRRSVPDAVEEVLALRAERLPERYTRDDDVAVADARAEGSERIDVVTGGPGGRHLLVVDA